MTIICHNHQINYIMNLNIETLQGRKVAKSLCTQSISKHSMDTTSNKIIKAVKIKSN